ncbi:MAG TPA: cytochrome c oxidase subunit II [Acidimicrobiia bacterium]|jgi:cytochrome c oxidase subunit 2|nr:cytochrome c oxidase subunit II [Acidimicrobiia bacterium]
MSDDGKGAPSVADQPAVHEPSNSWIDPTERKWFGFSIVLLVAFAITVGVAGFALGFQVPGSEARVNPNTVADEPPFNEPGLRELAPGEYEVYMLAKQFLYEPNLITVPEGSRVTFFVTATDVQHGFKLQDTNVNMQIVPGQVSRLTAEFDEPGTYPFICHEFCGLGHAAMFGNLVVEPAAEGE